MKKVIKILIILILLIVVGIFIKKVFFNKNSEPVIDKEKIISANASLDCIVFDGQEIIGTTTLVVENGKVVNEVIIEQTDNFDNIDYFLMPGLIDAHSHITSKEEIEKMINNGIMTTYDVAASKELVNSNHEFNMWSSITTIMPGISDGKATVNSLIAQGADYIKVMIDMPKIMGGDLIEKEVLQDIVLIAHKNNLKVAAHVTTVEAVELAVNSDVDILIHVPIGETFPDNLAKKIADENIAVIPTLAMMKEFANSPLYGYKKSDYKDAEKAVKLLNSYGVPILMGTDSSNSFFVPKIEHGNSLYIETELLVDAGLTSMQVLQGATNKTVEAFGLEKTSNQELYKSIMVLVEGRPDQNIKDLTNIRQIWIDGEPVFDSSSEEDKNIIGNDIMNNDELIFIPKHPSNSKTTQIETKDSPLLEQSEPIETEELFNSFVTDFDSSLKKYEDKRFEITGIVTKVGPDIHNKPSVELSNKVDGRCHILCVFPSDEIYKELSVGDSVVLRGNYLVMSNWYGIVMKKCETSTK